MIATKVNLDGDVEPSQLPALVRGYIAKDPVSVINAMIEYGIFSRLRVKLVPMDDES